VQQATYEQKDPLLIYKFESFELFRKMIQKVNKDIIAFLFKGIFLFRIQIMLRKLKLLQEQI